MRTADDRSARRRYFLAFALAGVAAAWLSPAAVRGQLVSDTVPFDRTIPEKEDVTNELSTARLRLGPIRMIPSIEVTDAGYDSNVYATTTDVVAAWTATVRGGIRLLVPFGPKVVFRADAFPQYTWYDQLDNRNFFGGTYTGSLFGFFNRLTVQLTAADYERYQIYSSEFDSRVFTKTYGGLGRVELELSGPFYLFGNGDWAHIRYTQEGVPVDDDVTINDRDEWSAGGGVRYSPSPVWSVSLAAQQGWADFVTDGLIRNNTSTAYLAGFQYSQPRLFINLSGGYREGRAASGSIFPEYSTGVGSFFVSFFPIRWLELRGVGSRRVAYSLSVLNPYYYRNRIGGAINIEVLSRFLIKGFGEVGPNEYPIPQLVDGVPVNRRDDARIYGGGLSIRIVRSAVFTGTVSRTIYESNIPGDSRDFTRFTAFLSFGGQYVR